MKSKVKLIKRDIGYSEYANVLPSIESNESFEQRINDFLSTHKCNPPVFLSVDLCYMYYEEDSNV